jgi:hypothetical protein
MTSASEPVFAEDGLLTFSTGADYTTGKYGQSERTDVLFVPFIGRYETGRWIYKVTVPYIRITGPGNVVGSGEDRVTLGGGGTAARRTESGLGDVTAGAFYNVLSEGNAPVSLDLGAKIKLGTADKNKGLGTGKTDYAVQADVFKALGQLLPFATLGYRWYGDPEGVDLRNVFYGSVGASYRVSQPMSAGLAYDFRPAITATGGRVSELIAFMSYKLSPEWKMQLYAVKGYATASPDFGAGAVLGYSF